MLVLVPHVGTFQEMCLVAPAAEDPSAEACEDPSLPAGFFCLLGWIPNSPTQNSWYSPKWRQDAVLLGDGREIWRLEPSGHLVSQDGRCLVADSTGVRLTGQCDNGSTGQAG